jgi:hypothetical protein
MFKSLIPNWMKWAAVKMAYSMKSILPRRWYYGLLKWLVKTKLVSCWDKIAIQRELFFTDFFAKIEVVKNILWRPALSLFQKYISKTT